MLDKQLLGQWGEEEAVKWLCYKGLCILERNWRSGRAEIDIIAKEGERLVFVEVKCRSSHWFDFPEDAVSVAKQRRMLKAASAYCLQKDHQGPVRFDVISIMLSRHGKRLLHYRDAFYPMGGV